MDDSLTYQFMSPADVLGVSQLVARVFNQFIAPEFSYEGVKEFHRYIQPSAFLERQKNYHFALISVVSNQVVGVIEVRTHNHVSLLFVAPEFQRRGIARELFHQALQICLSNEPQVLQISVNSSSCAMPIYEKLGFHSTGEKQIINGISFIPMALKISKSAQ